MVALDASQPLLTLGRLVQEDLCLMQKQGDAHVLTAAILCCPASWTLAEKLGRSMAAIHLLVQIYTPDLASCLDGITRDSVLTMARDQGIEVIEKRITRDEIYCAD